MAKYCPYLSSMAPGVPLLSPGYGATEGVQSLAVSLLRAVAPLPPVAGALAEANGGPLEAAAQKLQGGAHEAYVLLPHLSAFYEFLPEGGGAPCT